MPTQTFGQTNSGPLRASVIILVTVFLTVVILYIVPWTYVPLFGAKVSNEIKAKTVEEKREIEESALSIKVEEAFPDCHNLDDVKAAMAKLSDKNALLEAQSNGFKEGKEKAEKDLTTAKLDSARWEKQYNEVSQKMAAINAAAPSEIAPAVVVDDKSPTLAAPATATSGSTETTIIHTGSPSKPITTTTSTTVSTVSGTSGSSKKSRSSVSGGRPYKDVSQVVAMYNAMVENRAVYGKSSGLVCLHGQEKEVADVGVPIEEIFAWARKHGKPLKLRDARDQEELLSRYIYSGPEQ